MSEDSELLHLHAKARLAEDQYWRMRMNIEDSAVHAAAHKLWTDAQAAVQSYKEARESAGEREQNETDV